MNKMNINVYRLLKMTSKYIIEAEIEMRIVLLSLICSFGQIRTKPLSEYAK